MFAEILIRMFLLMGSWLFFFHAHYEFTEEYTAAYQHQASVTMMICAFLGVVLFMLFCYKGRWTDILK